MSKQWCTHPTAHEGKTKVGSRPNHPLGDRRLTYDLRIFMEDSYRTDAPFESSRVEHRLCRTCFEKENYRFITETGGSMDNEVSL